MLALDGVLLRLGTTTASGVRTIGFCANPVDDREASEPSEPMALGCSGDQVSLGRGEEPLLSLAPPFWREVSVMDLGLSGNVDFCEDVEGEPVNLMLRALKLHFFDGVLGKDDEDSEAECEFTLLDV